MNEERSFWMNAEKEDFDGPEPAAAQFGTLSVDWEVV
jgi:hypothetical protein